MGKTTNVYYTHEHSGYFDDDSVDLDDLYQIETMWDITDDIDQGWIAEECADDFHSNHDGWESSWPIEFKLWSDKGVVIGVFEVDRDVQPVFHAYRK